MGYARFIKEDMQKLKDNGITVKVLRKLNEFVKNLTVSIFLGGFYFLIALWVWHFI